MPEICIDISVYCATCGAGLCNYTSIDDTSVAVKACPYCIEAKEKEINELEEKIRDLEDTIEQLEGQIEGD